MRKKDNTITIKSTDNTDTLIFVDKIQCIIEKEGCVEIYLRDNVVIKTDATFSIISEALRGSAK